MGPEEDEQRLYDPMEATYPEDTSYPDSAMSFDSGTAGAGGAGGSDGETTRSGVERCETTADLPIGSVNVGKALDLKHHWLRTPEKEAGMGPGNPDDHPDASTAGLGSATRMQDHTGRGNQEGSHCTPIEELGYPNVDREIVNRELEVGKDTGDWYPDHTCQDVVRDILVAGTGGDRDYAGQGASMSE
jgi:hypothetical protein